MMKDGTGYGLPVLRSGFITPNVGYAVRTFLFHPMAKALNQVRTAYPTRESA
jgi:hypothetical protein